MNLHSGHPWSSSCGLGFGVFVGLYHKCLGFGHIAANCPTKRTMIVKGGQVVSEHSDQSSRSNSLSPSKNPSDNECEIPCEKVTYW